MEIAERDIIIVGAGNAAILRRGFAQRSVAAAKY
jgi:hypothetical protein